MPPDWLSSDSLQNTLEAEKSPGREETLEGLPLHFEEISHRFFDRLADCLSHTLSQLFQICQSLVTPTTLEG